MRPEYKPRQQQLIITKDGGELTRQYTWKDVAHECYAELSGDGRAQADLGSVFYLQPKIAQFTRKCP